MWEIKKGRIVNFFSHKDTAFEIQNGIMTMLLGINKTSSGADSNGSGKSAIMEGITLSIADVVARGVKKDEFINDESNTCSVNIYLTNDVLKRTMEITRTYHRSKTSEVTIEIDGAVEFNSKKDRSKKTDPEVIIFKELGITKEDFLNYFAIGQGNNTSFFTAGDTNKKAIISRFSNFEQLDALIAVLKAEIKVLNEEIAEKKTELHGLESSKATLEETLETEEADFKTNKERRLTAAIGRVETAETSQQDALNEVKKYEKQLTSNKTLIEVKQEGLFDDESLLTLNGGVVKFTKAIEEAEEILLENKKLMGRLTNLDGKKLDCPSCSTSFIPDSKLTPAEVAGGIKQLQEENEVQKDLIEKKEKSKAKYKAQLKEHKDIEREIVELQDANKSLTKKINYHLNDSKELGKEIDTLKAEVERIKSEKIQDKLGKGKTKLESYLTQIDSCKLEISTLQERLEDKKYFEFHFDRKGLKTYLANKSIRDIQDISNYYLNLFKIDLQVLISGYKTNKSGDLKDEIEVSIVSDGINQGLFNKYSGGEKSRVNMCGIIAINKLINNAAPHGKGLNFLGLDENVAYLDTTGQNEVLSILGKSQITTLLIMHHMNDVNYPHKLYVLKKDKESRLINRKEFIKEINNEFTFISDRPSNEDGVGDEDTE